MPGFALSHDASIPLLGESPKLGLGELELLGQLLQMYVDAGCGTSLQGALSSREWPFNVGIELVVGLEDGGKRFAIVPWSCQLCGHGR